MGSGEYTVSPGLPAGPDNVREAPDTSLTDLISLTL